MLVVTRMGCKVIIDSPFNDKQDNTVSVLADTMQQSEQLEIILKKGINEGKNYSWCVDVMRNWR